MTKAETIGSPPGVYRKEVNDIPITMEEIDTKKAKHYTGDELVLVECQKPSAGAGLKLDRVHNGPYQITKSLVRDRYIVDDIIGEQSARSYETTMAVDKMKFVAKQEKSDKE